MAETVKKSRIVSDGNEDDNLEDALMEEFNNRLKNCMSEDNIQEMAENEPNSPEATVEYANIEIITTKPTNTINRDFILAEKENYYDIPAPITTHKLNGTTPNGDCIPEIIENIYEPIEEATNKTEEIDADQMGEITPVIDRNAYENLRPNLVLTDLSEPEEDLSQTGGSKSVKDRMLLSTDAESCLLFTQTVTSPMLTPSEENVDFLKGFSAENGAKNERLYENTEFLAKHEGEEVIYENLTDGKVDVEENFYENVEELKKNEEKLIEEAKIVDFDDNNDVLEENENVKSLIESEELKSVDIMKQIRQFESDDSTQVTETYVETTTVESNASLENGKALKKKKTKKSRKEEKENISVSGITNKNSYCNNNSINSNLNDNNNEECFFYNVNVKNLCRSFGDLTKLNPDENSKAIINQKNSNKFKLQTNYRQHFDKDNNRTREKFRYSQRNGDNSTNTARNNYSNKKMDKLLSEANNAVKSSFSKFDALQKKNVLHVRSSDSSKAQEKFNGGQVDSTNCRSCDKAVFQMEQIKAEKAIWHKNCFRCTECNKQLNVDTYQSHEGALYCKPHFKALFAPKAVEDDQPKKPRKPELIIRENQPVELPAGVVRASDKPDLGLEELQSLNVKQRFQVFENHQQCDETDRSNTMQINVKRSPSILSKLARFQAKGMDIGVSDDTLNGIPIEESSSEEDEGNDENGADEEGLGEDADLIRAKRVQKEKPFHFTGMTDVKNRWEQGEQISSRDERREERKQEIQSIRNRLFMGKQGKMKEAYQQAVMESESCTNLNKEVIEVTDTKSLKERFEKGDMVNENNQKEKDGEDLEVFESEISKKSRSLFLELDANASKAPQCQPIQAPKLDVKKAREAYISKSTTSEDVVKSSVEQVENIEIRTADIQQRFKFFETYKEPLQRKKEFRITPPREGQVKAPTPDREVYRDPEVVRSEENIVEDSTIAKQSHTATKMLNKFRQMEEDSSKEPLQVGPKPLKCFTPPPEPTREQPNNSEDDESEYSDEEEEENEDNEKAGRLQDDDLIEAQKAARAKQLRAKFERWEANEIKKEQNGSSAVNIIEEFGEDQSQIESTKALRARFESMKTTTNETSRSSSRAKVNRFVELPKVIEMCDSCQSRVYPLEKISIHNRIYHKKCFKCKECSCILRMDSYSYNQGLLYCLPHFKRLFISKGNYDTGFGLGQHKEKWNATVA